MKLGTQTGSLTNHILSRAVVGQPDPVKGMGATILAWTDRYPATITLVSVYRGRRLLWVREDKATRVDGNGMSECQQYTFEPDPDARTLVFQQERNGAWVEVAYNEQTARYRKTGGYGLRIGERSKYHDFSF